MNQKGLLEKIFSNARCLSYLSEDLVNYLYVEQTIFMFKKVSELRELWLFKVDEIIKAEKKYGDYRSEINIKIDVIKKRLAKLQSENPGVPFVAGYSDRNRMKTVDVYPNDDEKYTSLKKKIEIKMEEKIEMENQIKQIKKTISFFQSISKYMNNPKAIAKSEKGEYYKSYARVEESVNILIGLDPSRNKCESYYDKYFCLELIDDQFKKEMSRFKKVTSSITEGTVSKIYDEHKSKQDYFLNDLFHHSDYLFDFCDEQLIVKKKVFYACLI